MAENADDADALAREMAQLDEGERIRWWRRGMEAAEERQRRLRAIEGPKPAQAVAESLSALSALEAMGRWPARLDPVSELQVQAVRERWSRIQGSARAQAALDKSGDNRALRRAIAKAIASFQDEVRRIACRDRHSRRKQGHGGFKETRRR